MIFEKVRPATPRYKRLTADWDMNASDFEISDFKDPDMAWKLAEIARDLDSYERRFLGKVLGSTVMVPSVKDDMMRHAGCVKPLPRHAEQVISLSNIELARSGLGNHQKEQLRQSTEVLALPHNLISRQETRAGTLEEAQKLLPPPFIPA